MEEGAQSCKTEPDLSNLHLLARGSYFYVCLLVSHQVRWLLEWAKLVAKIPSTLARENQNILCSQLLLSKWNRGSCAEAEEMERPQTVIAFCFLLPAMEHRHTRNRSIDDLWLNRWDIAGRTDGFEGSCIFGGPLWILVKIIQFFSSGFLLSPYRQVCCEALTSKGSPLPILFSGMSYLSDMALGERGFSDLPTFLRAGWPHCHRSSSGLWPHPSKLCRGQSEDFFWTSIFKGCFSYEPLFSLVQNLTSLLIFLPRIPIA